MIAMLKRYLICILLLAVLISCGSLVAATEEILPDDSTNSEVLPLNLQETTQTPLLRAAAAEEPEYLPVNPGTGTFEYITTMNNEPYTIDNMTAFSVLYHGGEELMTTTWGSFGLYVFGINGITENSASGGGAGWMYQLNGVAPMMMSEQCTVEVGDKVVWYYVEDMSSTVESSPYVYAYVVSDAAPEAASVNITGAPADAVSVGASGTLTGTVLDQYRKPFAGTVVWSSNDTSCVTVAPDGSWSAEGPGTAEITASSGDVDASVNITVAVLPEAVETENTVTDGTWGAAVPARVVYEFVPTVPVTAPVIEHGSGSLMLTDVSVTGQWNGEAVELSAEVSSDGELIIHDETGDARTLTATFTGRLLGDVTNDAKITVYDAQRISRYLAGIEVFDEEQLFYADVTNDDAVTVYDAQRISRYLAGAVNDQYE